MKTTFITGLIAATTLVGTFSQISPAAAFEWNNAWSQSPILSKSQTGFNDAPFQQFVQKERVAIPGAQQFQLDPAKLKLAFDHNVSVFFINEGAGFRNQLAYESTGTTKQSGLLFNDISCEGAGCVGGWGGNALKLGDGVNIGNVKAGSQLDFWLRADGWNKQPEIERQQKEAETQKLAAQGFQNEAEKFQLTADQAQQDVNAQQQKLDQIKLDQMAFQPTLDQLKADQAAKAAAAKKAKGTAKAAADQAAKDAKALADQAQIKMDGFNASIKQTAKDLKTGQDALNSANNSVADRIKKANDALAKANDALNKAKMANDNVNIFGTQTASNADGLQHVVSYAVGNYIMLGFEDLFGDKGATGGKNQNSDRDFNDTVIVLDLGADNVRELVNPTKKKVPEPSVVLPLAGVAAFGLSRLRRRRQGGKA
jgi:hypothetical protein